MAERQHTPPKTVSGWYFYHKTKNYHVMLKATRSGVKTATKLAAICTGYEFIQFSSDIIIFDGTTHPASSVISGFITSGIFSRLVKLPKQSTIYAMLAGTGVGLLTGCLQEAALRLKASEEKDTIEV
ncbi:hypothetical protein DSO57_1003287 [Entomophthora muscae]|uniref:Uncharacterized protein n=1 Tax=Entomophthora muscae TaxID=34485 RepID=A0ACC2T8B5_9FUNG|nr:hypothetical protein DSO57_1003287 [Entomophthora muscae]